MSATLLVSILLGVTREQSTDDLQRLLRLTRRAGMPAARPVTVWLTASFCGQILQLIA